MRSKKSKTAWCGGTAAAEKDNQKRVPLFSFPSPGSVKGRVLADLLEGQRITHLDVWLSHGSSRAAHHILKLREGGWPVETDTVDAPTRDGRTARIAEYWLPREVVNRDPIAVRQFLQAVRGGAA